MRKPFSGEYSLTQVFGVNPQMYAQFGLKGHNGLDYGLPNSTKVLAPHNGKVIESTLDTKGYGLYVKIENSIEGSLLAHCKELRVGVGDIVEEGQLVALSDNSGNSTGPHLHWGYYRIPRDRKNGYAGFIDQTPFLNPPCPKDILDRADAFVAVADKLQKPVDKDIILADIDTLLKHEDLIVEKDKTINLQGEQLRQLTQKASELEKTTNTLSSDNQRLLDQLQKLTKDAERQTDEIAKLQKNLEEVKNYHLVETAPVSDLISELFNRFLRRR
jgi:septal ring factor EnvC (AmiA/AmiB activator)